MLMKIAYLRGPRDVRVPVQIGTHQGKTLIECRDAAEFLKLALTDPAAQAAHPAPAVATLRGVFTPGQGALLHIMDSLGTAGELRLPEPEAAFVLANIW